jgi:putative autoinducer-2 (AI-2) aldolase
VPVLIAGGAVANRDRDVLEMVHGAIAGGAKGLTMGRKVWGAPNPRAVAEALIRIVRHGASVDEAMEALAAPAGAR